MPINVQWDNTEKTALMIVFQRPWTWRDFDAAVVEMLSMFNTVHHRVNVIFDIREGGLPPADAITHFKKVSEINHPNGGELIFVAPSVFVRFINGIVRVMTLAFAGSGTFKAPKFIFTKSPEEARAYLLTPHTVKAS